MSSGELNRLVSIRQNAGAQGTDGFVAENFVQITDGECWANILHLNGKEAMTAGKDTSVVQASVKLRYRTDVLAAMRVYDGSDVYEIKAVLPNKRDRKYVFLLCELLSGN